MSFSPAADRNKAPILAALEGLLPAHAAVLEIASGTGQHAAHFAAAHPRWTWRPTDADAASLAVIAACTAGCANVAPPLHLDVRAERWPAELDAPVDAVYCANLLHIAPWPTCAALMRGAAARLAPGGLLAVYGPFRIDGEPLAPGNVDFDADLRSRDASWGLRRLSDVSAAARTVGLALERRVDLPANNTLLVFRAEPAGRPG